MLERKGALFFNLDEKHAVPEAQADILLPEES